MNFTILFGLESKTDIQDAIAWYNKQRQGLGKEFYLAVRADIERLRVNPYFQIRYDNVRCLPMSKYPFMIHFTIDEVNKAVFVRAIFNTALNPKGWKERG